jgi:hypothetical protein
MSRRILAAAFLLLPFFPHLLFAAPDAMPPVHITHASGPITVDGDLSEAAWKTATKLDTWYETNPGDNVEPKMKNVGYLTFDDHFLYAGFEFDDPAPAAIRAPYVDRDNISQAIDYAGIIVDARNDRKTAVLMLATPRGIQYDSVSDDTTGNEDPSPDFYWDSAAKINDHGWTLEIRVPFSSLRYKQANPMEWGIMLYRNYPRDRRYQMFANRIPRGGNCFICNERTLVGMGGLPKGGHLVAAPYVTVKESGEPRGDLGTDFLNKPARGDGGLDIKWTPSADHAVDATVNPDFSQIESDVAAIAANERFAIFFPEKRPFFLEGVELFNLPIQAVYTRTITSPRWGLRATGKIDDDAYTILVADDRGGGTAVIPGSSGSNFADQDFETRVVIGRLRHDIGTSFIGGLLTDRESSGGAHNRVLGPDFQWRPTTHDTVTGQYLYSDTVNPNRPDLSDTWNGETLKSSAGDVWWSHSTEKIDWFTEARTFGRNFRADSGFIPQAGFRENFFEGGYTIRPKGFFSRFRTFLLADYQSDPDGALLFRDVSPGVGWDGKWSSNLRIRYSLGRVRSGTTTASPALNRNQIVFSGSIAPSRIFSQVTANGTFGQDIDFQDHRTARGANLSIGGTIRPSDHLELALNNGLRWLNVGSGSGRLFTAQIERVKATYTLSSRTFIRYVIQNIRTINNPGLFAPVDDVSQKSGGLSNSILFAYKLNWQTVMFLGLGDNRALVDEDNSFEPSGRQIFLKLSYAFQR